MTISYNWLREYLPVSIEPERLSEILTSIGLEVEKMEPFEDAKGGLKGLVIGEVLEVSQHPNADKLKLTKVNIEQNEPLQIVCGAPNVAQRQKVVIAPVGSTIFPMSGEPMTMKIAKIRGVESYGMICAEDEIGLGPSHAGIMVLADDAIVGQSAAAYFQLCNDIIFEIGLTPNRTDAMSHWGVARDVCAYLSHHDGKFIQPKLPNLEFQSDNSNLKISVQVEDKEACPRYSGVSISNVTVHASPKWLQNRLRAIGLRPINNIVDATNFIMHETGQPLHAFDYDAIKGSKIVVKKMPEGTAFQTLDEKIRKLSAEDLMICNAEEGICIAGVFGGIKSGVTADTKNIFLESAFFDPVSIRKTSFRHGLRTDAATRFEKGIDISQTVNIVQRAAVLIKELAGGEIASEIIDIYPDPKPKTEISLTYAYLKKLSGKHYEAETVKNILSVLGFNIINETPERLTVEVPYHKRDVSMPADLVEEVLRIDGLDNIEIPSATTMTPSIEEDHRPEALREKIAQMLAGAGFSEILTNSITNSNYYIDEEKDAAVKLLNNLSTELDILKPNLLYGALEIISFNINRKNNNLKFFEFGKIYKAIINGQFEETAQLSIYLTGNARATGWKEKEAIADLFYIKGIAEAVLKLLDLDITFTSSDQNVLFARIQNDNLVTIGRASHSELQKFDIRQAVFFADFNWDLLLKYALTKKIEYRELSKYPPVERDLAMVVPRTMNYGEIEDNIRELKIATLQGVRLFDLFESEKLGKDKKSIAVNLTFVDHEKTLIDKETDQWMLRIMNSLEKELNVEIRK